MQKENISSAELLSKELLFKSELAWNKMTEMQREEMTTFSEDYKRYLSISKTERLCVDYSVKLAKASGFKSFDFYFEKGVLKSGDKVYFSNNDKTLSLFIIGKNPFEKGLSIVGAHIDSPRLDIKPQPLYEDSDLAFMKTHYYGGIKKYQWVTIPLAIHGVVIKTDGAKVNISLGEDENDPVFCITDLLPHLSKEQDQKKMAEGITGEGLNLLVGSIPYSDDKIGEPIKLNILKWLHDRYGIKEIDFTSAELEVVPAGKARDVGFDRSLIGSYGQDDRICAYTALRGILDFDDDFIPERTICTILADKEEIGSYGSTGMGSEYFKNQLMELIDLFGVEKCNVTLRRALYRSACLSADVTAAYDPTYSGTHDLRNASYIGKGIVVAKYGGARGKSGSNDAHPEFLGKLRACFDENNVVWQTGELGKIDLGGGGTIAWMLAQYGMDVVDCGPGVLSMHAPLEISSKNDVYMSYLAYHNFFKSFN